MVTGEEEQSEMQELTQEVKPQLETIRELVGRLDEDVCRTKRDPIRQKLL